MKGKPYILDGLRLALNKVRPIGLHSPLYEISSLLMGDDVLTLSASGKRMSTFIAELERYSEVDSLPAIEFPSTADKADAFASVISLLENIIIKQAGIKTNVAIGLKYMIDECTDNILEHSRSEFGYISSSIDKKNGILEVCIADKGITVLGSYRANSDADISSDLEALQAANRGISTKNRPNAENRGYGLMTTKKMAVSGLGGAFAMISGSTIFVYDKNGRKFIDSSNSLHIPGTIITIQVPYSKPDFNYINYIE